MLIYIKIKLTSTTLLTSFIQSTICSTISSVVSTSYGYSSVSFGLFILLISTSMAKSSSSPLDTFENQINQFSYLIFLRKYLHCQNQHFHQHFLHRNNPFYFDSGWLTFLFFFFVTIDFIY
jgi:hypothetical protein